MTDSPDPKLQYLSEPIVTANHAFIRFHGRKQGLWYNYLYSKQELEPWVKRVDGIKKKCRILRIYFNNHYGGRAIVNALQFKEMTSKLTAKEKEVLLQAEAYLTGKTGLQEWLG